MPAILNEGSYDAWLTARQDKAREFLRAYPSNWLTANPVERKQDKKPKAGWAEEAIQRGTGARHSDRCAAAVPPDCKFLPWCTQGSARRWVDGHEKARRIPAGWCRRL
jgi:hypothetical protein